MCGIFNKDRPLRISPASRAISYPSIVISRMALDSSVLGCTVILEPDFVTPRTLFAAPLCEVVITLSALSYLSPSSRLCNTLSPAAHTRAGQTLHNQISSHHHNHYLINFCMFLSTTSRYFIRISNIHNQNHLDPTNQINRFL